MAENFTNFGISALALGGGTLSNTDLTIAIGNGSNFPTSNFFIVIDAEIIYITTRSTNTLHVSSLGDRGREGTAAATHDDQAIVYHSPLAHHLYDQYNHIAATTSVHGIANTAFLVAYNIMHVSANYNANSGDIVLVDASSGITNVTLPNPSPNLAVIVKKVDSSGNAVRVFSGSGTVDGASIFSMGIPYMAMQFISDSSNWFVF